jgi:hypothetical protein
MMIVSFSQDNFSRASATVISPRESCSRTKRFGEGACKLLSSEALIEFNRFFTVG